MKAILLSLLILISLSACEQDPENPPVDEEPSFERCDAITTQRECFEKECDYFTTATTLTMQDDSCTQGSSSGVCLFAPQDNVSDDTLTYYQRTLPSGVTQSLQLNVNAAVEGWTRCGSLSSPPDCNCDGIADVSEN